MVIARLDPQFLSFLFTDPTNPQVPHKPRLNAPPAPMVPKHKNGAFRRRSLRPPLATFFPSSPLTTAASVPSPDAASSRPPQRPPRSSSLLLRRAAPSESPGRRASPLPPFWSTRSCESGRIGLRRDTKTQHQRTVGLAAPPPPPQDSPVSMPSTCGTEADGLCACRTSVSMSPSGRVQ